MVGHTVNSCPFTRPPNNIRCHICNVAGHLARNCRMTCGRCNQTGHRTAICQAPVPWPQFQRRIQQVAMRRDQRYQALARPPPPRRPAGELLRQINNGQQIRGRDEGQERRVPGGFSNSPRFVDNRMVVPGNFPQTETSFSQNLNYNDLDEEVPPNMNYNNSVGHININNGAVKSKIQIQIPWKNSSLGQMYLLPDLRLGLLELFLNMLSLEDMS